MTNPGSGLCVLLFGLDQALESIPLYSITTRCLRGSALIIYGYLQRVETAIVKSLDVPRVQWWPLDPNLTWTFKYLSRLPFWVIPYYKLTT